MSVFKQATIAKRQRHIHYPDECPICHRLSEISLLQSKALPDNTLVEVIFQCGFAGCLRYFIGYYGTNDRDRELRWVTPQEANVEIVPEFVTQLSPSFMDIFRQAENARTHNLDQIAGPGYRKAFEFLIKDYAKSTLDPEEQADEIGKIESMFSGNVIGTYVHDKRIEAIAKRALWLGNDESHYLRKWENHDIEDLIRLIKLSIHWIEIERESADYLKEMHPT